MYVDDGVGRLGRRRLDVRLTMSARSAAAAAVAGHVEKLEVGQMTAPRVGVGRTGAQDDEVVGAGAARDAATSDEPVELTGAADGLGVERRDRQQGDGDRQHDDRRRPTTADASRRTPDDDWRGRLRRRDNAELAGLTQRLSRTHRRRHQCRN